VVGEISDGEARSFVSPGRVWSRGEVLARPSPVPDAGGVYGWWFRRLPPLVDASGCCQHEGLALLYVGISPRRPHARELLAELGYIEPAKLGVTE
jgi:hypothetical protein